MCCFHVDLVKVANLICGNKPNAGIPRALMFFQNTFATVLEQVDCEIVVNVRIAALPTMICVAFTLLYYCWTNSRRSSVYICERHVRTYHRRCSSYLGRVYWYVLLSKLSSSSVSSFCPQMRSRSFYLGIYRMHSRIRRSLFCDNERAWEQFAYSHSRELVVDWRTGDKCARCCSC